MSVPSVLFPPSLTLRRVQSAFTLASQAQRDLVIANVSRVEFQKIKAKLQQESSSGGRTAPVRVEYHSAWSFLVLRAMPSPVHESVTDWFLHILSCMERDGFVHWKDWLDSISRNGNAGKCFFLFNSKTPLPLIGSHTRWCSRRVDLGANSTL